MLVKVSRQLVYPPEITDELMTYQGIIMIAVIRPIIGGYTALLLGWEYFSLITLTSTPKNIGSLCVIFEN